MINSNSKTMITTALTGTIMYKNIFLGVYFINILGFMEQVGEQGFYDALVKNTPVQVLTALGILAGLVWILRRADNAWTNHIINIEKTKQEQIKTKNQQHEQNETFNKNS